MDEIGSIQSLFLGAFNEISDETNSLSRVILKLINEIKSYMKVLDFAQEVFTSNTLLNETNYNDFDRSFKKSYQDSTTQSNTESSKIGKNYSCKQN
jgi:hypothetical protein